MGSEAVWIVAIVAAAIVIVLFFLRDKVKTFRLKADGSGLDTTLETGSPAANGAPNGISVSGSRMIGKNQKISVKGGDAPVAVDRNTMIGEGQEISVDGRG